MTKVKGELLKDSLEIISATFNPRDLMCLIFSFDGDKKTATIRGVGQEGALVTVKVPAETSSSESFTIPHVVGKATKILSLEGEDIEIERRENRVKFRFTKGTVTLPVVDSGGIEDIGEVEEKDKVEIPDIPEFLRALKYAISYRPSDYHLGDIVQLTIEEGKCFVAGTNSVVLNASLLDGPEGKINLYFTEKQIRTILRSAALIPSILSFTLSSSSKSAESIISISNEEVEAKLILPQPVQPEAVNLKEMLKKITREEIVEKVKIPGFEVKKLKDIIKLLRSLAERVKITCDSTELVLSGNSENGEVETKITTTKPGKISISLSPSELGEIISAVEERELEMWFWDEEKPFGIFQKGEEMRKLSLIAPILD